MSLSYLQKLKFGQRPDPWQTLQGMTPRRRIDPFSFCCNIFYRENFPPPNKFTLRAGGGTILALTTKHKLVTDKTLLARPCWQKWRTVPKRVFPPSKHPLLVSFALFRKLKAALHLLNLNKTLEQVIKQRKVETFPSAAMFVYEISVAGKEQESGYQSPNWPIRQVSFVVGPVTWVKRVAEGCVAGVTAQQQIK